jgi:signal transduction histidine kinase
MAVAGSRSEGEVPDLAAFRLVVEGSPNGVLLYHPDAAGLLRCDGINASFLAMAGWSGKVGIGDDLGVLVGGLFPPALAKALGGLPIGPGRRLTLPLELPRDGGPQSYSATIIDTTPGAAALILVEETQLRRDADELRRARLLLERAEDMAGIGSFEFDYRTGTVRASPGAVRIYGATGPDFSADFVESVPLPEFRALLDEARENHIKKGLPYDVQFKIRRLDDGAILDIHSRASYDPVNKRLFGIIRDITREKRADEEIHALNRELEARVEARTRELSAANAALSSALRELEESHARELLAEKMAALGRLVAVLAHELNTPLGAIKSESESGMRDSGRLASWVESIHALDGEELALLLALLEGSARSGVSTDLAGQRRRRSFLRGLFAGLGMEDASLAAEELVDLEYREKEDELRRRAALPGFSAIVHLAWELSSGARADAVIHEAAEKADKVVRALRTYGDGGLGQKITRVDLREGIELALAAEERKAASGVRVETSFSEGAEVLCFPEQLEQVWFNLASNAFQAMGKTGLLQVGVRREGEELVVAWTDDGPGIPAQLQERVFTPFFSTKPQGEARGLGLDISRRVLEEMGGSIAFESRPGRTCFTVRLKAAPRKEGR